MENKSSEDLDLIILIQELFRQLLHIGVGIFTLGLRWFGFWYGACFAFAAFFWNLLGMPRLFRFTFREEEKKAGFSKGMLAYAVSVLILILFFPLPVAAAQWGVLSVGDGAATFIGTLFGKRKLFFNPGKSYVGSSVIFITSFATSLFLFWFTQDNFASSSFIWQGRELTAALASVSIGQAAVMCLLSSTANTLVESIPLPRWLDDNITVPVAGAIVMLLVCGFFC